MKRSTKLRLTGGAIVLVNLWAVGHYSISGLPVLLMTLGVAAAFEFLLVRPAINDEATANKDGPSKDG